MPYIININIITTVVFTREHGRQLKIHAVGNVDGLTDIFCGRKMICLTSESCAILSNSIVIGSLHSRSRLLNLCYYYHDSERKKKKSEIYPLKNRPEIIYSCILWNAEYNGHEG